MSKDTPTLADNIIREWSRSSYRRIDKHNWIATHIARARKFVLDESMSTFMADLAYVSLRACKTEKSRRHLVESVRKLARLPHALTWIEYDKQAHRKRVKEVHHPEIDAGPDTVPDRAGWLLMQHPELKTAFMALHCTSHAWDDKNERIAMPNAGQFAYAWCSDESIPPWPRDPYYHRTIECHIDPLKEDILATPSGVLTGILEYATESVSVIRAPYITSEADKSFKKHGGRYFHPLGELSHDARYLWTLLSTINHLPTSSVVTRKDGGYMAGRNYKKFSEHSVITLTVPTKRYLTLAKRALAMARRRAHQVRGYWRSDHWHPGELIWIEEHERGDASLGYVLHDYKVERGESTDERQKRKKAFAAGTGRS